ncbi:MAG: hypothetical protein ACYS0G_11405 [Planctomycetota bacterium]
MLPARNAGRCVRATAVVFAAMTVAGGTGPSEAARPGPAPAEMLPDAGDVVAAYATLRGWIDGFDLPAPQEPAAAVGLRGARGVCVILRRSGRVVGMGVDTGGGELMPRGAAGRALGEVLGDPAVASLPPELADGIGPTLTLELEVAGRPVPLLGRTFGEVTDQLAPGLDGVAVRRGNAWALLFPAQMRAANTAGRIERLLPALAVQLGLAPTTLPELSRLYDVSIYRFRTTHLAQPGPDRPPFVTFRGDTIVTESDVTRQSIAALADGIASHLIAAGSPPGRPLGVRGTYRPAADRYDPLIAPPLEQALTALALARYSAAPGVDRDTAAQAASAGLRILRQLQKVAPGEDDPLRSLEACAAIVHAGHDNTRTGEDADVRRLVAAATTRVCNAYHREHGFVDVDEQTGQSRPIPPHGQAIVASALGRLLRTGLGRLEPELVRAAIDAAWESLPEHRHVSLLPWLGWAERDFAEATHQPIARAAALRKLRTVLDASRFGSPSRPGPPDLEGGFALGAGGRLTATAQTLRPAAFLAGMIRDGVLTPDPESNLALGRHLKTMRFVMQLATRSSSTWALRNPPRALGGIRAAPWDADQPVAAQALGLITAAETLISLETLGGGSPRRQRPGGASPQPFGELAE